MGFLSSEKEKRHFSQEIWWLGNTVNPPRSPVSLKRIRKAGGSLPLVSPGVKDPPGNAGDTDSTPDQGRSHRASKPTLPQLLSPAWPRALAL